MDKFPQLPDLDYKNIFLESQDGSVNLVSHLENLCAISLAKSNQPIFTSNWHISNVTKEFTIVKALLIKLEATLKYKFKNNKSSVEIYTGPNFLIQLGIREQQGEGLFDESLNQSRSPEIDPSSAIAIGVISNSEEVINDMNAVLGKIKIEPKPKTEKIYVVSGGSGLNITEVGPAGVEFNPMNYNENVEKDFNFIVSELNKKETLGRIIILEGPPGCGKTFLIRSIMKRSTRGTFLYVPSNMVDQIAGPDFIDMLLRWHSSLDTPIVLLIEDADRCLATRMADNVSVISTLLNMTDGILGRLLNIRILATTNADSKEIDPAIRRPGRLLKETRVSLLAPDRCTALYKQLTNGKEKMYNVPTSLAEVYFDSNSNGESFTKSEPKPAKRKLGF